MTLIQHHGLVRPHWPPLATIGHIGHYVGPNAPAGLESNWIPTAGKRPLPTFRFYGATEALNKKTFKMPDFELVR